MTPIEKFQDLLRSLFQTADAAELDFGIYRILNLKRVQFEEFISTRLPAIIDQAFTGYTSAGAAAAQAELDAKRASIVEGIGEHVFDDAGDLRQDYRTGKLGREYMEAFARAKEAGVREDMKVRVYNDLYNFFSRYYEDGDFITRKRIRYSGNEVYAVPYSGEEVVLHWATKDQYYVKTSERFKNYRFRAGDYSVVFELRSASTEQNNSSDKKRYFVLTSENEFDWNSDAKTWRIFFEYRPLTASEQINFGRTEVQRPQEGLNEAAAQTILAGAPDTTLKAYLATTEGERERPLLRRHLIRFTRRNTSDFFIHKDLGGFLRQELDYFIKAECLLVEELVAAEDARLPQSHIIRARIIRRVAAHIIDFLAQIEDFQKRLFEKRKFVLRTEYCLTLDRVPENLWDEVLTNEAQLAEWQQLYSIGDLLRSEQKERPDRAFLRAHPTLVIDTRHFPEDFKWRLLAGLNDLDDAVDGVLVKSENCQALNLLLPKYRERVLCTYLDPPFNTGGQHFIYKNGYRHSSWCAMLEQAVLAGKAFLAADGTLAVAIDDYEQPRLEMLLNELFTPDRWLGTLAVETKPSGRTNDRFLATCHEYHLFYASNPDNVDICFFELPPEQKAAYNEHDGKSALKWRDFLRTGGYSTPDERPNSYYSIYFNPATGYIGLDPMEGAIEIKPLDSVGRKRVWRKTRPSFLAHVAAHDIKVHKRDDGSWRVCLKDRIKHGIRPKSVWVGAKYDAATHGTKLLKDILGKSMSFDFPKSLYTVMDAIYLTVGEDEDALILDYFGGSGTTAHAVMDMNRRGGQRKYILIEMGDWTESVILPRVKKVAYCADWSDGKPAGGAGVSHVMKYALIEQYEDTLGNIEVRSGKGTQMAMEMFGDEYLLRYMLDSETQGSTSLLNLDMFKDPFAYRLKAQVGDEVQECAVDLIETFNYLMGLDVRKLRQLENDGRRYRVVLGEKNGKRIAVVWRSVKDIENDKAALMLDKAFVEGTILPALLGNGVKPDRLFVNGASFVENAEAIEPEFKRLMFAPIG